MPLVIGCDEQGQIPTRLVDQYELAETGLTYDPSPVVLGAGTFTPEQIGEALRAGYNTHRSLAIFGIPFLSLVGTESSP